MSASKLSFSVTPEMNAWIEEEMRVTRRTRSSIIQEAIEMLQLARNQGKVLPMPTAPGVKLSKRSSSPTLKRSSG